MQHDCYVNSQYASLIVPASIAPPAKVNCILG
jgi:hypothetical protein